MTKLSHKFVEFIPDVLEEGVLYVSLAYGTVSHRCCCGCGNPVYLPLSPTQWRLTFDGESISIDPSVGSWSLPCRSHYWIRANGVHWTKQWTPQQVEVARKHDRQLRDDYFSPSTAEEAPAKPNLRPSPPRGPWVKIKAFLRFKRA